MLSLISRDVWKMDVVVRIGYHYSIDSNESFEKFQKTNEGQTPMGLLFASLLKEEWSRKLSHNFRIELSSWEVENPVPPRTRKDEQKIVFSFTGRIGYGDDRKYELTVKSDESEKGPELSDVRKKIHDLISAIEKRHEWEINHLRQISGDLKEAKEELGKAV